MAFSVLRQTLILTLIMPIVIEVLCSSDHLAAVHMSGDIILGGLFPVHEKGDGETCGPNVYHRGVQRLEAMIYAVDLVNNDTELLPHIKLGVHILDTCSRDTYALNQSLQFVRSSLNNLDTSAFQCGDGTAPWSRKNSSGPVFGVIGGSYSSVSLQVANLLRLFHIPQISPASTAKALSDKSRFDLFARTVPPDNFQSAALVDIVKMLNWSYVSSVYSEGSYGEYGIEQFHKDASERNVCIALSEKVPSSADDAFFNAMIRKLQKKPNARGVVLFTRAEDARRILLAAKRANLSQPFHWLASDGWGRQTKLVDGVEDVAEGAITVELQSEHIAGFDKYMGELSPATHKRNPWFEEFWEEFFGCKLKQNFPLKFGPNQNDPVCNESWRLTEKHGYEQESKTQFVIDAVYAFAHALHALHHDVCVLAGSPVLGVCPEMAAYDGKDFYNKYLLNVAFTDVAGSKVKFDRQGDGLARYDILNLQKNVNSSGYHYKLVGKWYNTSDGLELNLSDMVFNGGAETPSSACSLPCEMGMIKKQQGDTCCWICDKCEEYEYVLDEVTCRECPPGQMPFADKLSCFTLPVKYIRWDTAYALVPLAFAGGGIVITISVITLFIRSNDTPLVRASGRELSYMLLFGILVCYCNTFALLARPTIWSCVLQRFGIGVGFSIVYGALLTKTNRISRIFDSASISAQRPNYISPRSQVTITSSLVAVQVVITMVWMVVEPPGTRNHYPDREQVILKCNIQDMSFLVAQMYNMVLITVCTVYAVKTRKIPENFNESKFIGFTMYTTCIIWLAFVPIYFSTENSHEIQMLTLCVSISLSATVSLACLYSPKVYILLFHPDKNVRKLTMNSAAYRRSGGGIAPVVVVRTASTAGATVKTAGTPSAGATSAGATSADVATSAGAIANSGSLTTDGTPVIVSIVGATSPLDGGYKGGFPENQNVPVPASTQTYAEVTVIAGVEHINCSHCGQSTPEVRTIVPDTADERVSVMAIPAATTITGNTNIFVSIVPEEPWRSVPESHQLTTVSATIEPIPSSAMPTTPVATATTHTSPIRSAPSFHTTMSPSHLISDSISLYDTESGTNGDTDSYEAMI